MLGGLKDIRPVPHDMIHIYIIYIYIYHIYILYYIYTQYIHLGKLSQVIYIYLNGRTLPSTTGFRRFVRRKKTWMPLLPLEIQISESYMTRKTRNWVKGIIGITRRVFLLWSNADVSVRRTKITNNNILKCSSQASQNSLKEMWVWINTY